MTSGAFGQLYGNGCTIGFPGELNCPTPSNWKNSFDTTAATEISYLSGFFNSFAWYNLVPDQTHSLLTAGYGTYSAAGGDVASNDYATAALSTDNGLAMLYVPTSRTLTVNLARWAARYFALVRHYHQTLRRFSGPASLANSGSHNFATPGDWHSDVPPTGCWCWKPTWYQTPHRHWYQM